MEHSKNFTNYFLQTLYSILEVLVLPITDLRFSKVVLLLSVVCVLFSKMFVKLSAAARSNKNEGCEMNSIPLAVKIIAIKCASVSFSPNNILDITAVIIKLVQCFKKNIK